MNHVYDWTILEYLRKKEGIARHIALPEGGFRRELVILRVVNVYVTTFSIYFR